MADLFASSKVFQLLFAGLSPKDATAVLTPGRTTRDAAEEFHAALIFLFSRQCYDADRISMQMLQKIWLDCAQSLVDCDLNPSLWLHAVHVNLSSLARGILQEC